MGVKRLGLLLLGHIGQLLYQLRCHRLIMWLQRKRLRVVVYHAFDDTEGDAIRGLYANTAPAQFEEHLAYYATQYVPVSLADLDAGRLPHYPVLITIDDGYRSVYRNGLPLLRKYRQPAALYVITDVVGNRGLAWPNALAWLLHRHSKVARAAVAEAFDVAPHLPVGALVEHVRAHFDVELVEGVLRDLWERVGLEPSAVAHEIDLYASWRDLRELQEHRVTIGSHTASHPNLGRLDGIAQRRELGDSRDRVGEMLGDCTSVAYPFGNHDSATRTLAEQVGYLSMMEIGIRPGPLDPKGIGRVPVTATTKAALFSQIEVVEPCKAFVRQVVGGLRRHMSPRT